MLSKLASFPETTGLALLLYFISYSSLCQFGHNKGKIELEIVSLFEQYKVHEVHR
jgi:hypothetical protein